MEMSMNIGHKACVLALSLAGALTMNGPLTQARAQETHFSELANLPFAEGRPTAETTQKVHDELLFQRATQTYLWAMPLINTLGMQVGSEKTFGAGYNVLPIWKKRLDAKTLVTTPNSDVLYAMSYVDLGKDGPLVMDAPPELQGILLDYWQRPIPVDGGKFFGDVGFAGPDGGKGGKFLLLPPGYKGTVPEGYFVYRSSTKNVFIFLRGFFDRWSSRIIHEKSSGENNRPVGRDAEFWPRPNESSEAVALTRETLNLRLRRSERTLSHHSGDSG